MASGDGNLGDDSVATFDPLYPNLGAFTDAPLYYYSNQINAQVNAQRRVGPVILRADLTVTGRYSNEDAIYASSGRPLLISRTGGHISSVLFEASTRWAIGPGLEAYASMLRANALSPIKNAGGEDAIFGMLQITAIF